LLGCNFYKGYLFSINIEIPVKDYYPALVWSNLLCLLKNLHCTILFLSQEKYLVFDISKRKSEYTLSSQLWLQRVPDTPFTILNWHHYCLPVLDTWLQKLHSSIMRLLTFTALQT
jgi:hypothetical protein